jgi:hypothetical protein
LKPTNSTDRHRYIALTQPILISTNTKPKGENSMNAHSNAQARDHSDLLSNHSPGAPPKISRMTFFRKMRT